VLTHIWGKYGAMQIILDTNIKTSGSLTNFQIGYVFFRVFVGSNLFMHGFIRILTGVSAWAVPEAATFADTFLPMPLVNLALYLIPYVQIILGSCIFLGLFTRWALFGGLCLFFILLFGHTVRQNWSIAHIVMQYGLYYWILLAFLSQNRFALDNRGTAES
jgi:thiosulfate dehydrogenase (quinone) large subunit